MRGSARTHTQKQKKSLAASGSSPLFLFSVGAENLDQMS